MTHSRHVQRMIKKIIFLVETSHKFCYHITNSGEEENDDDGGDGDI